MNKFVTITAITIASAITFSSSFAHAKNERTKGRGAAGTPVIYVTSQNQYYDTILLGDLPYNGTDNFQKLEMSGPSGVQTEFGPTDTGYYGGRWWVDANMNDIMDDEDVYFLCPLLGPGRDTVER